MTDVLAFQRPDPRMLDSRSMSVAARARAFRVAFVNTGMLGHRSVARLFATCVEEMPDVEPVYLNLSQDLTLFDRGVRGALSLSLAPAHGPMANLDLKRWRQELNLGWLAARRLSAAEQEGPFHLLHFHTQAAAYASLSRLRTTPAIVSIDTTQTLAREEAQSSWAQLSYQPNIAHDRIIFRLATAITATSQWAARDLTNHEPDLAGKVHVMPYPVPSIGSSAWIEERYARASTRKPRVLFIGGDFTRKGGDLLVEVWRDSALGEIADLDLVTDWPIDASFLPPGVHVRAGVLAYSPAWLALWRDADLFVMPTRHEAFGMVYQEAASAGVPVVATRINAIPEIVRHDQTGLLMARDDRAALAAAIRQLVASPELRRRLGEQALETIRRVASLDTYRSRLHGLITDAVFNHGFTRT